MLGELILLVDDEPNIIPLVGMCLESSAFWVIVAEDVPRLAAGYYKSVG
jgi:hypothetical protein